MTNEITQKVYSLKCGNVVHMLQHKNNVPENAFNDRSKLIPFSKIPVGFYFMQRDVLNRVNEPCQKISNKRYKELNSKQPYAPHDSRVLVLPVSASTTLGLCAENTAHVVDKNKQLKESLCELERIKTRLDRNLERGKELEAKLKKASEVVRRLEHKLEIDPGSY